MVGVELKMKQKRLGAWKYRRGSNKKTYRNNTDGKLSVKSS